METTRQAIDMERKIGLSGLKSKATTILVSTAVILALLLGGALVFAFSGVYNVAAKNPHTPLFRWMVGKSLERSVRYHAEDIKAPDLSDSALLREG